MLKYLNMNPLYKLRNDDLCSTFRHISASATVIDLIILIIIKSMMTAGPANNTRKQKYLSSKAKGFGLYFNSYSRRWSLFHERTKSLDLPRLNAISLTHPLQ